MQSFPKAGISSRCVLFCTSHNLMVLWSTWTVSWRLVFKQQAYLFIIQSGFREFHSTEIQRLNNDHGFNSITIKNHYPLTPMSTAFKILQAAKMFTKLDPHNAYYLICIKQVLKPSFRPLWIKRSAIRANQCTSFFF